MGIGITRKTKYREREVEENARSAMVQVAEKAESVAKVCRMMEEYGITYSDLTNALVYMNMQKLKPEDRAEVINLVNEKSK